MSIGIRLSTIVFAAALAGTAVSGAEAQRRGGPPSGTPRNSDCKLVVDTLAGHYNSDDRRVWLDITVRNIGTTLCPARDSTTLTFYWKVSTWYLGQTNDGQWVKEAPLTFNANPKKYPANGVAFGDIQPAGTKTVSITPAGGYSVSAEKKFIKADIYVSNAHIKYENQGQMQSSPMVSKGILVEK